MTNSNRANTEIVTYGVVLVKCTYSLIALIKLDLPLPESPVIAMFTSTSRHFSSLFLKNSSMFDTPLSSISFLSSAISIISHSLKSPMLNRENAVNGVTNVVMRKCCFSMIICLQRVTSFKSLVMSCNL